jgi:SAM-dependent methyltransferase
MTHKIQDWSNKNYWQKRFDIGDTPWELGNASGVLKEAISELAKLGVSIKRAKTLVPGCGTGEDALFLAHQGADVIAVDWSTNATDALSKKYSIIKDKVPGTLKSLIGDFFAVSPEPVELVCEHTFFCAIDPINRDLYVTRMLEWLKPGGYIFGNFFILPDEGVTTLTNNSLAKDGGGPPFASTVDEINARFGEMFSIVYLKPAANPEASRRPGLEWVGIFKRK